MKDERKLEKINESTFKLIVVDGKHKHRSEKIYDKSELRNIYQEIKAQVEQLKVAKVQNDKELEKLDVKDDPELRVMAQQIQKALKLDQYDKLMEKKEAIKKDLRLFDMQLLEISTKIPEVLRK